MVARSTGQLTLSLAGLIISDAGAATLVRYSASGTYASTKQFGNPWSPSVQVTNAGSDLIVAGDHTGDVAFYTGHTDRHVVVAHRGGAFVDTGVAIPDSFPHFISLGLATAASGDVVLLWTTYDPIYPTRRCGAKNFIFRTSRLTPGSSMWAISVQPPIAQLGSSIHSSARLTLDDLGHTAVARDDSSGVPVALTQAGAGKPWVGPTSLLVSGSFQDMRSDATGNLTAIVRDPNSDVHNIRGLITSGAWRDLGVAA